MSGILRLENLNKGTTLKQGDKTVLSYRLSDADGDNLNIAGNTAVARLMHPDFTRIGYESEALTVSEDNIVQFSIDSIIPSRLYYLEITVDGQYIFPSRSDEGKLSIDRSSMGAEITIIENAGIDTVVRKAVDLINEDPSLIIDEDKLISEIIANTSVGSIEEYYQEYRDAIKEYADLKPKALNAISKSDDAITLSESVQEQLNQVVIEGDSSVEASQARVNADGVAKATLKQRLDDEHNEVTAQLAQKVGGGKLASLNDIDEEFLNFVSDGTGGPISIESVPKDESVTPEKTTFLRSNNLIKQSNLKVGYSPNTGAGVPNVTSGRSTIEEIVPIKKGKTYISTAGTHIIALYNHEGEYVEYKSPSTIKGYMEFTAEYDGFARPSFYDEFTKGYTFVEKGVGDIMGFRNYQEPLYRSVDYGSVKQGAISTDLTDFAQTGKNLFDKSKIIPDTLLRIYASTLETDSGQPRSTAGYFTSEQFFPLSKGISYTLSNVRVWNLYTFDKTLIKGENTGSNTATVVITPEYDCLLRISANSSLLDSVQIEEGTEATSYEPYHVVIPSLKMDEQYYNPLQGKKIANAGDSIAAGESQTLRTYGKIIADKNNMTFQSWAQHGASIGEQEGRGKITEQIDAIVATGIKFDYVLVNGGTNDGSSSSGTLTTGYDDALDKTSVIGGLEYIFKTLRENLPDTKILYIRVHNMSSRSISTQERIGDHCLNVCKKWSIPYVDLYNEGQLNTNIEIMKTKYTLNGDSTHPTLEGYEKFYVPPIEGKMRMI